MKIKSILNIIAGLAFFALAPRTHAACTQTCTEEGGEDSILWGTSAGGNGGFEIGIGEDALKADTGIYNIAIGNQAMDAGNSGDDNIAIGGVALAANTTGSSNVAVGMFALNTSTTGDSNTAVGYLALAGSAFASTGSNNTALGWAAISAVTTGSNNTAEGYQALFSDTTGNGNVADGYDALYFNKTGSFNTATGRGALYKNTASDNVATGYQALNSNTSGTYNTAVGTQALQNSTTGTQNTAVGYRALNATTLGLANVAFGYQALLVSTTGSGNIALGDSALVGDQTGVGNIAIGLSAGSAIITGNNNIDIANNGANESSTIRIGGTNQTNTYIAGISGVSVAGGIGVIVDSNGHLGTTTSSARYKDNIQPMGKGSEAILSLQPVTFHYKKELDPKGIPQFGLVAEQVEKVNPDLIARDEQGKPYSVRYEAVNAMLLNEFLKEHRKVESLEQAMAEQQKQIKALTASLQKVSDQVELSKPVRTAMVNDPGKH